MLSPLIGFYLVFGVYISFISLKFLEGLVTATRLILYADDNSATRIFI
jgi:hypothetical protein